MTTADSTPQPRDELRALLQSITDVARAIFGAAASSIFLLDESAGELVFEAVSGQGENVLIGTRFPAHRGIAGWVVLSGEPMVVDDLATSRSFATDLAESTDYVPTSLMAAPLIYQGQLIGVLEVLDPAPQSRSDLGELDLLALFARQGAIAVRLVSQTGITGTRAERTGCSPAEAAIGLQLLDQFKDYLAASLRR